MTTKTTTMTITAPTAHNAQSAPIASSMSDSLGSTLNERMRSHGELTTQFLDHHFALKDGLAEGQLRLLTSMRYSLLQLGAKRFRPAVAMMTAEALDWPRERVLAFSGAVEAIHTYSLIHDDSPSMDNDDFRRGEPTNHRKYDEATAILAGDALCSEAFAIISENYSGEPELALRAVGELSRAVGALGMVGGQALDILSKTQLVNVDQLRALHSLKTGALIRVSVIGAATLCRASEAQLRDLDLYAVNLGLAFQVADDIIDFDPEKVEPGSYPALLGLHQTREFLNQLTASCLEALRAWPMSAQPLRDLAAYNSTRTI